MLADQPLIPLYFYVAKHLVSPQVRGWRDNPWTSSTASNSRKIVFKSVP